MLRLKSNYLLALAATAVVLLTSEALADTQADNGSYLPPQNLQAPKQEAETARPPANSYPRTALNRIPKAAAREPNYRVPPHSATQLPYAHRRARRAARPDYASPRFPGFFFGLFQ